MQHPASHHPPHHQPLHLSHSPPPPPVPPERYLQHTQPLTPRKCSAHPSTHVQRLPSTCSPSPPKPHLPPNQPPEQPRPHPQSPAPPGMPMLPVDRSHCPKPVPNVQPLLATPEQVPHTPHSQPTHSTADPAPAQTQHPPGPSHTLPPTHLHLPPLSTPAP